MVAGGDAELKGLTIALRQELSAGLGAVLEDAGRRMRAQAIAEGIAAALAAGGDPARSSALLSSLPPPADAREAVLLHLLRATALSDGQAPTLALAALAEDLAATVPLLTLAQADYILRGVNHGIWSNRLRVSDPLAHDLAARRVWHALLDRYRDLMPPRDAVPSAQRQRDLIVLMTGQFITGMHQPSINMRHFISRLVLRLGRRVVLINTADGPAESLFPFLAGFTGGADPDLAGANQLVIDRLPVPFVHLPPGFTGPDQAAALRDHLLSLKPDLVLSFGTMSVAADLCRDVLDVVAIPFGSYLPVAEPTWLALPRAQKPTDLPAVAIAGLTPERVMRIDYSYDPPARGEPLSRAILEAPDDAILTAVIGLRLEQELTPAFLATLETMLAQEPRLFFLFIGPVADAAGMLAPYPRLALRSRALGFVGDVTQVLAVTDLYLNPPRGGGGASSAYALACGVPVFTLDQGDVATVTGPDFHLRRLTDFATLAGRFADDAAYRIEMKQAALARFDQISSRERMLRQILDGVKAMRAAEVRA